jgi:hypothetical protein
MVPVSIPDSIPWIGIGSRSFFCYRYPNCSLFLFFLSRVLPMGKPDPALRTPGQVQRPQIAQPLATSRTGSSPKDRSPM